MKLPLPENINRMIDEHQERKEALKLADKLKESADTDRAKFAAEVARDIISKPLARQSLTEYWENIKNQPDADVKLRREIDRRAEGVISLFHELIPGNLPVDMEKLAEFESHAREFADIMSRDDTYIDLKEAYIWAMGGSLKQGRTLEGQKKEKEATIVKYLKSPNKDEFNSAAVIISMMPESNKRDFIKNYMASEKMDPLAGKNFIMRLNKSSALSPIEAEKILGTTVITDEEMKDLSQAWTARHNYLERAKYLASESIGAKNAADEMINFKNAFALLGYVSGGLTILLNAVADHAAIRENPMNFFSPHVMFGMGEIGAAYFFTHNKGPLRESFAGKAQQEAWAMERAKNTLKNLINESPRGWRWFLQGEKADNFGGAELIGQFVNQKAEKGKFKKNNVKLEDFEKFLKAQNKPELLAKYRSILEEEGNNTEQKTYLEERFKMLCQSFFELKIGGTARQTANAYRQAIK